MRKIYVATILAPCLLLALPFGVATVAVLASRGSVGQAKLVREGGRWPVDHELGQWYGLAPDMT